MDSNTAREDEIEPAVRRRIEERCRAHVQELLEEHAAPGISAALILPDKSELTFCAGFADVETKQPMSAEHRMLSGSVGKTYFAAAAHHLMVAGKLDFDRKAIEFFPDQAWFLRLGNAKTFTVRHLLRHQSGLARYVFKPEFFKQCLEQPDKVWTPHERLAFVFDDPAEFDAGAGWAYSDTNFIVLGMILESVGERPAYDYIQAHLLDPLGLKQTCPSDRRKLPKMAQGYVIALKPFGMPDRVLKNGVFEFNPQFEWAGGGFASTPLDLTRWARALYSGAAFEGDYLAVMIDGVPSRLGPGIDYGHGVMLRESDLGPHLGHDGIDPGYRTAVEHFPALDMSAAVMVNTDVGLGPDVPLNGVIERLVAIAVEELEL